MVLLSRARGPPCALHWYVLQRCVRHVPLRMGTAGRYRRTGEADRSQPPTGSRVQPSAACALLRTDTHARTHADRASECASGDGCCNRAAVVQRSAMWPVG